MKRRILIWSAEKALSKCKSGLGLFDKSPNVRSVKIVLRSVNGQGKAREFFWALMCGNPELGKNNRN